MALSNRTYRDKYRSKLLEKQLRNALVAEKVCTVDRDDVKRIDSPFGTQPNAVVQALTGTYSVAAYNTTDDVLNVDNEIIVAEHVFNFEKTLSNFDLFDSRQEEMGYAVATKIDRFVVNSLCKDGTTLYTTAAGGFTNVANINKIFADLGGLLAGYSEAYNGLYLIIENTEVSAITQAQSINGFSFADAALNNGFMTSLLGIDIYVVRAGTFASETLGTSTFVNVGRRVAGVKNMATYASPRDITYEEKGVSGKTGKEIVMYGYIGFKLWTPKAPLTIRITLTP